MQPEALRFQVVYLWWLGSVMVRALELQLDCCEFEFDSRPLVFQVVTLDKLFTHI